MLLRLRSDDDTHIIGDNTNAAAPSQTVTPHSVGNSSESLLKCFLDDLLVQFRAPLLLSLDHM